MRRTNFARPHRAYPGRLALLAWLLAAVLATGAAWAFLEARTSIAAATRLEAHSVRLGTELSTMNSSDISVPTETEFAVLSGRIDRLNALSGPRHVALPVLLSALERALPSGVWVSQMAYSAETGAFAVSLLGETETDLPAALQRIEAIPDLGDVILERQVRVQSGTRNLLQYDIRAAAR